MVRSHARSQRLTLPVWHERKATSGGRESLIRPTIGAMSALDSSPNSPLDLAAEFPAATDEQWRVLDAGTETRAAAAALLAVAADRGLNPTGLTGSLGADPIGLRARTGADHDASLLADLVANAADYPNLQLATVDGAVYHDAGAAD